MEDKKTSLSGEINPNIANFANHFTYNKETQTISFVNKHLHCIKVNESEKYGPQAKTEFIGGTTFELDLSPSGDKAILRSDKGALNIKIKPSPAMDYDRIIVGVSGKNIIVGDMSFDSTKDGKDGLIEFLNRPYNDFDSTTCNYLEGYIRNIATKNKLCTEYDFTEEMKELQKRDDFAFGKDYSFLYDDKISAASNKIIKKEKSKGR